jgi:hypothetical protein
MQERQKALADNMPRGEAVMPHIVCQTKKVSMCSEHEKEIFYRLLCQGFLGVSWNDFM